MTLLENTLVRLLKLGVFKTANMQKGEQPFKYTSGNYGPGYLSIKELVGHKLLMQQLCIQLASKISRDSYYLIDFVAGNVTGGVVPGWLLSHYLGEFIGRLMPFIYVRKQTDKVEAQRIVGITDNPYLKPGSKGLVVEELINYGTTVTNTVELLRDQGYIVRRIACIAFYGNEEAKETLLNNNVEVVYLFSVPKLLYIARKHGFITPEVADDFFQFLSDPKGWQAHYGLK